MTVAGSAAIGNGFLCSSAGQVANRHLPNFPSVGQVLDEGVNVGEMNALLLEKIEELTLYIIDLQKQIDELKK